MNIDTATERPAVAVGGGGGRRWRAALVVIVIVAIGAAAFAVAGVLKGTTAPEAGGGGAFRTSTALVTRRTLVSQTQVSATLADAGAYTIVNQATGTITTLPAVGRKVRQGGVLYQVSGTPVVLLYGSVPDYRDMSEGLIGADVREFNKAMIALGYTTRADVLAAGLGTGYFSAATATAWQAYQTALGVTVPSAKVTLGQVVFLPTAAKISAWESGISPGVSAAPGAPLMTATSNSPVVTIALDTSQQAEVKAGDRVSVTLPSGAPTPGRVTSVGTVAITNASTGVTTIPVLVALKHPAVARHLSSAPVTVSITTGEVRNALVVPVTALLAQPAKGTGETGGGYAVEVAGAGGHHLVPVSVGMIDNAAGLAQVTSSRLTVGQRVVVPAL
jgi:hypothetical protein